MDPRTEILSCVKFLSYSVTNENEERITRISQLFQENSELKRDRELAATVLDGTKGIDLERIQKLRETLIYDSFTENDQGILKLHDRDCLDVQDRRGLYRDSLLIAGVYDVEKEVLTITQEVLSRQKEQAFWGFIQSNGVKELKVEGKSTYIYTENVLQRLLLNRPPLLHLTEAYELEFADGSLTLPRAKLELCGKYIKEMLEFAVDTNEDQISFKKTPVTLQGFRWILFVLEKGQLPEEAFQVARQYLNFNSTNAPAGSFGPKEWELHYDLHIEDIPPVPEKVLEKWESPCSFREGKKVSETHILFLLPKGLSYDKMLNLARNPKMGRVVHAYRLMDKTASDKIELKRSRWVLLSREIQFWDSPRSKWGMFDWVSKFPGYKVSSKFEVFVGCILQFMMTGERLMAPDQNKEVKMKPACFVKDKPEHNWQMLLVGPFFRQSLSVHGNGSSEMDIYREKYYKIGVMPVFKP